jgi:transposase-like protein
LLSKNRDQAAAVRSFKKAIDNNEAPEKITIDGSRASHQAVAEQRCYPMLGVKTFGNAEVTLSGIELANKIKKGQFDTSEIIGPGAMILQVWEAVLAA